MDIAIKPKNKITIESLFFGEALLTINRRYPIKRLRHAHRTLTMGEDGPLPGGVEKGLGNASPETPCIK
jgi:hypothetical protein